MTTAATAGTGTGGSVVSSVPLRSLLDNVFASSMSSRSTSHHHHLHHHNERRGSSSSVSGGGGGGGNNTFHHQSPRGSLIAAGFPQPLTRLPHPSHSSLPAAGLPPVNATNLKDDSTGSGHAPSSAPQHVGGFGRGAGDGGPALSYLPLSAADHAFPDRLLGLQLPIYHHHHDLPLLSSGACNNGHTHNTYSSNNNNAPPQVVPLAQFNTSNAVVFGLICPIAEAVFAQQPTTAAVGAAATVQAPMMAAAHYYPFTFSSATTAATALQTSSRWHAAVQGVMGRSGGRSGGGGQDEWLNELDQQYHNAGPMRAANASLEMLLSGKGGDNNKENTTTISPRREASAIRIDIPNTNNTNSSQGRSGGVRTPHTPRLLAARGGPLDPSRSVEKNVVEENEEGEEQDNCLAHLQNALGDALFGRYLWLYAHTCLDMEPLLLNLLEGEAEDKEKEKKKKKEKDKNGDEKGFFADEDEYDDDDDAHAKCAEDSASTRLSHGDVASEGSLSPHRLPTMHPTPNTTSTTAHHTNNISSLSNTVKPLLVTKPIGTPIRSDEADGGGGGGGGAEHPCDALLEFYRLCYALYRPTFGGGDTTTTRIPTTLTHSATTATTPSVFEWAVESAVLRFLLMLDTANLLRPAVPNLLRTMSITMLNMPPATPLLAGLKSSDGINNKRKTNNNFTAHFFYSYASGLPGPLI